MPKVDLFNMNGDVVGEIQLADEIFGSENINETVIHQVVKQQLANKRQGTQSAKTRSEVSGGGKKPYRQKGTARAGQGSIRAPQYRHGGVVFAPKPRDYSFSVPKKVKRLALKGVLASKVAENNIRVLEQLQLDEIKTKSMVSLLNNLKVAGKSMIVIPENDEKIVKSTRNIDSAIVSFVNTINILDLMNYDTLIVTKDAVSQIEEVYR